MDNSSSDSNSQNFTPSAGDDEYGSAVQECLAGDDPAETSQLCRIDSFKFVKKKTKHKSPLEIIAPERSENYSYSVVSGKLGGKNQSTIELNLNGLSVVDCNNNHTNQVVQILNPDSPHSGQETKHTIQTGFEFDKFTDLLMSWKNPVAQYPIHVQTCNSGRHKIDLITYSDLKLKFGLGVKLEITEEHKFGFKFTGNGSVSCDGGDSEATVELEYADSLGDEEDKKTLDEKLSLKIEVKSGAIKLGFSSTKGNLKVLSKIKDGPKQIVDQFNEIITIPRIVYNGVTKTNQQLEKLSGLKKLPKSSRKKFTWTYEKDVSVSASFYHMEDEDSFDVGYVREFELEGVLFGVGWKWDFTEQALSLIPWGGRVIAYLNEKALEAELGGIELKVGCSGKASLKKPINVKSMKMPDGTTKKLKSDKPALSCNIQLSLEAKGSVRISLKTKYVAKGEFSAGVTAETDEEGTGFTLFNSKMMITGVIYKETCSYEQNTSPGDFSALAPPQCEQSTPGTGSEVMVFDEKEIFNFK